MSNKTIVLFTVLIDVIGVGVVIPVLPFYVQSFSGKDIVVTALFALFSFCSFISSPLLGALSDRIGRRPVLLVSLFSTAVGWIVFAMAKNIPMLFLGRIIDGLAAGNFTTAQSYLVDMAETQEEKTHNLGQMGAIFGVGFIIGPLIGGLLGSIHHTLPFWFVGILALVNTVLAYIKLPETLKQRNEEKMHINPIAPIVKGFQDKKLWPGLMAWGLFGLSVSIQMGIFTLFLQRVFGYTEVVSGFFMAGMGLMIACNQGFAMKRFWIKRFKEPDLELYMLIFMTAGYLLMGIHSLLVFLIGLVVIVLTQSVLRVVMNSQMAGIYPQKQGEVLGVMNSVISASMVVGPLMAGVVFEEHYSWPYFLAAFFALIAFGVVVWKRRMLARITPDEDAPIATLG